MKVEEYLKLEEGWHLRFKKFLQKFLPDAKPDEIYYDIVKGNLHVNGPEYCNGYTNHFSVRVPLELFEASDVEIDAFILERTSSLDNAKNRNIEIEKEQHLELADNKKLLGAIDVLTARVSDSDGIPAILVFKEYKRISDERLITLEKDLIEVRALIVDLEFAHTT